MIDLPSLPWAGLLVLGAWHGVNPAMGWLFAVALAAQEESGWAVWRALGPLALGHAIAVGVTVLVGVAVGWVVPAVYLRWFVAVVLVAFGSYKLWRRRHPRWVGMRVGSKDLALWSALMATAHGAGLMVLPFVLAVKTPGAPGTHTPLGAPSSARAPAPEVSAGATRAGAHDHAHALAVRNLLNADQATANSSTPIVGVWATLVHAAAYLLVTGSLAGLVYRKLGLRSLRRAWLNVDVIWAAALILTGLLTPLL